LQHDGRLPFVGNSPTDIHALQECLRLIPLSRTAAERVRFISLQLHEHPGVVQVIAAR
jgi:hypothetical protein